MSRREEDTSSATAVSAQASTAGSGSPGHRVSGLRVDAGPLASSTLGRALHRLGAMVDRRVGRPGGHAGHRGRAGLLATRGQRGSSGLPSAPRRAGAIPSFRGDRPPRRAPYGPARAATAAPTGRPRVDPSTIIDRWADEVADAAADCVRHAVQADLEAGCGLPVALAAVRARMARLTPAQRERLVAAISAPVAGS